MSKPHRYTTLDVAQVPILPNAHDVGDEDFAEIINDIRFGEANDVSLTYYIFGVIERGLFDEAVRFTQQLIVDDPTYAAVLAEGLYDSDAPLASDAKWVEWMSTIADSSTFCFIEAMGQIVNENLCGEWVPGHRTPARYQALMKRIINRVVPRRLIRHGYLKKTGAVWSYSDEAEAGTLPITTCLDSGVLAELEKQYE